MAVKLRNSMKRFLRRTINRFGYSVKLYRTGAAGYPVDFSADEVEIIERVREYTMTSPERIAAVVSAIAYIVNNRIAGDLVECGVWRGGSMMAALYALLKLNETERSVYLFDTFRGMTQPDVIDISIDGESALDIYKRKSRGAERNDWCLATLDDVTKNIRSTNYPPDRVHLVEGDVMETIPQKAPAQIAFLRLDTDWYESTRHELHHLFPRLAHNGVLIIDDYGHWQGARQAVDEYFAAQDYKPLLHRIDRTGRCVIKR